MSLRRATSVLAALVGTMATTVALAPASQAAASFHGCPSGAFCLYPGTAYNGDSPEYVFFSYAGHNIFGETGKRLFVNNQTGGAYFGLCDGSGGTGGSSVAGRDVEGRPQPEVVSITKVNSIDLRPASQSSRTCRR